MSRQELLILGFYLEQLEKWGPLEEGSWSWAQKKQPQLYLSHSQEGEETVPGTSLNLEEHSGAIPPWSLGMSTQP